jgi:hypothetical protein
MKNLLSKLWRDIEYPFTIVIFTIAIGMVFSASDARAQDRIVLHTVSYHENRDYDYNEVNLGLGYRHQLGNGWSAQAGVYRNSYRKTTAYLIGQKEWRVFGDIHAGVFAGLASGYNQPVAAGLMASLNGITIRAVPPIGGGTSGVVALELTKAF